MTRLRQQLRRFGIAASMLLATMVWYEGAMAAQLTLTWLDAGDDVLGVSIERSDDDGATFHEIATTGVGISTYVDAGVVDGKTYCYRLRAFNDAGYSDYSNDLCGVARGTVSLAVQKSGTGMGTVTSAPAGINCGATCFASYPSGSTVSLSAIPAAGSTFSGWSGSCSGTGACALAMTSMATVTATFNTGTPTSFSDDFQRADSTALGLGWSEPQGDFYLSGGKLWNGTARTRHLAVQTLVSVGAGRVSATFLSRNNNAAPVFGLVFGYVDPLNYYAAYRQVGGSSLMKIVRVMNGVEVLLAQRACPNPKKNHAFAMTATFSTAQIALSMEGLTVSAPGTGLPAGHVGILLAGGGTSHSVDQFEAGP